MSQVTLDKAKARRLVDLKKRKNAAEKDAKAADKAYRKAERDFWIDLEESDMTTFPIDLGEGYGKITFQRRETNRGVILDPARAEEALTAMGLDDAILAETHNIRQKVLNEHVRDWIKSGAQLPEGIDFSTSRYVTVTGLPK